MSRTRSPASLAPVVVACVMSLVGIPRVVEAARPVLSGEATYGAAGGDILVHYATDGVDAAPAADANTDGVPDFVTEVATTAELALGQLVALGFRRPLTDGTAGGDGRIDIYLQNLSGADGSAGVDTCGSGRCSGHVIAENDYVGYAYPSTTEAIRSVVPHEVFHLVQYAYAMDQPATWSEGTAVWAVEYLYGQGNTDFERFLPTFLMRTYRPFERAVGGFGDGYPYGAALWPYFLEYAYGADAVVAAWTACENASFLDAIDEVLVARDSSMEAAWIDFTRWNAFTGPRMTTAAGYPEARGWVEAPREAQLIASARIYVEGLSARYVPVSITDRSRVTIAPTNGIRVAGWIVADGRGLADGIELASDGALLVATVKPGRYLLVVTGLSRGTITTAVELAIAPPLPDDIGEHSGCSSTAGLRLSMVGSITVALWRRRRRRT